MKRPKTLNARFVETVNRPGRYGDGHGGLGLTLLVKHMVNGRLSKTWSQRIRVNEKVTNVGLGAYPAITLAKARERALENARLIADGKTRGPAAVCQPSAGRLRKCWISSDPIGAIQRVRNSGEHRSIHTRSG